MSIPTPMFSPNGGIDKTIMDMITIAKTKIEVAIYSFTNQAIANALVSALKRGVQVDVVMDKSETHNVQATIHDQLLQAGAHVKLSSPNGGIMHNKFIIVDRLQLEWGSYNYTNRAEQNNYENATFSADGSLAPLYGLEFEKIFGGATLELPAGLHRSIARLVRRLLKLLKFA